MSTPLQGSWPSPLAANNTTVPPLGTTTPASPLPPVSSMFPLPLSATPPSCGRSILREHVVGIALVEVVVQAVVVAVICWLVSCCQRRRSPSVSLSCSPRNFTLHEVQGFTGGFSQDNVLGEGGFGHVYRGVLPNREPVAVKQLEGESRQRELGFQAEFQTVGRIHHKNVLSLVGYCTEGCERILVYELVPNGSLEFHLHGGGQPTLAWEARMKVAVGSAKGLAYLHEDCHPSIIHRDIKAANILVNFDFEAKIADFGFAKFASDSNDGDSEVVGTIGYFAPESLSSGEQTEKSDTFSFGVVLLELITGGRPVGSPHDNLAFSTRPYLTQALEDGKFGSLVDPRLQNNYNPSEMARMVACAAACVRESAQCRPKMSLIARVLEGHQSAANLGDGVGAGPRNSDHREPPGEYGLCACGSSSAGPSRQTAQDLEMGRMGLTFHNLE